MKARLLFVLLVMIGFSAAGQEKTNGIGTVTFESDPTDFEMWRDTISNPNNIWQIGKPQKPLFDFSYSPQNALITDTLNPYPINDTSVFYIRHTVGGGWAYRMVAELRGWYFVDCDSLNDFGMIEVSPNNGIDWINVLTTPSYHFFESSQWSFEGPFIKPTLTGHAGEWRYFRMNFHWLATAYNVGLHDTVLIRFTFISDSIQTSGDGLMFDDLDFLEAYIGIETVSASLPSTPSPNPASSILHFTLSSKENDNWRINLYTLHGQKVKTEVIQKGKPHQLSVANLPSGTYYYTITGLKTQQTSSGSVIISR